MEFFKEIFASQLVFSNYQNPFKKYKPPPPFTMGIFSFFPVVLIFISRNLLLRKHEVIKEICTLLNFLE